MFLERKIDRLIKQTEEILYPVECHEYVRQICDDLPEFSVKISQKTRMEEILYPAEFHRYVKDICDSLPERSVTVPQKTVSFKPILMLFREVCRIMSFESD